MFKKVGGFVFTSFQCFCVAHCITEHVADVFLVRSYYPFELKWPNLTS